MENILRFIIKTFSFNLQLGADPFGDNYREHLRNEGINTDQVKSVEGQVSFNFVISFLACDDF